MSTPASAASGAGTLDQLDALSGHAPQEAQAKSRRNVSGLAGSDCPGRVTVLG
jgi:hypothetical protein